MNDRPYSRIIAILQKAGLRPTRQRMALGRLLFESGDRHVTAEDVHAEAVAVGVKVSLGTVYNTLHQFTDAGLVREVVVEPGKTYFDTNTSSHHHFFFEDSGVIRDIPAEEVAIERLPELPDGVSLSRVDVVVRVTGDEG